MNKVLYNVCSFLSADAVLSVTRRTDDRAWEFHLQLGPGGNDTLDVYSERAQLERLRDAITAALDAPQVPVIDVDRVGE
jgi:hypothetical protein